MIPIYVKLFNFIFDKCIAPVSWYVGVIAPIFKNKGNSKYPKNYTFPLMSCKGKVFTGILNIRLASLSDEIGLLSSAQAGFRNSHSTTNNIFILHSLINLYLSKKKKLFCTLIDFSRAFDTIWRVGLWQKLIENNISGKCFNVIKSLCQNVKSCVSKNGQKSYYFACIVGVRQNINISLLLFSFFINDIEQYLEDDGVKSLDMVNEVSFEVLDIYLKIFLLLYADDTVLMSENVDGILSWQIDQGDKYICHLKVILLLNPIY